jgi:hypothetical protein
MGDDIDRDRGTEQTTATDPTVEPAPPAQAEAPEQPDAAQEPGAAPELAAASAPTPEPAPSLLEIQRRLAVAAQPPPWQPGDQELDPNLDTGWEKAAAHELPAIRPEDLPSLMASSTTAASGGAGDPALATAPFAGQGDGTLQLVPPDLALAPRDPKWRIGVRRAKAGLRASARPALLVALFGLGAAMGWTTWVRNQPLPQATAQPADLEAGTTTDIPLQVQSLISALNSDNQTQVQTVVPTEPYRLLAGELSRRDVAKIQGARALSTYSSDGDSATEILILGSDSSGSPVFFNLVVHLHQGVIAEFR